MQGPRQGVHLSPQHMQQWRQLHRFVQWRNFQFRDPDNTYVYRARIEPRPPQLPEAEAKQHNAAFPSRSHLLKRPSSVCSSRPRSASSSSPSHQPSHPVRTTSTTNLTNTSSKQTQNGNKQALGGPSPAGSGGQLSGSEFTLSATAISIQPRQPAQRSLGTKTNKQLVVNTASFPYPDPIKVKGDPSFLARLAELARLEAETVRSEQAKARLMLSARSRPTSAKSLKSSYSALGSSNSKPNGYTYQSNRRTSVNASLSRGIKRLNSSPAVSAYDRRTTPSSSLAINKQLSCTDLPTRTQTQSRKLNIKLDSVKETMSKPESVQEDTKAELSVAIDSLRGMGDESKIQKSNTPPTAVSASDIEVIENLGDGSKVQRSCSPPIVYIPAPPIKCLWSLEEGNGSGPPEKHGLATWEDGPEMEVEKECKSSENESTRGDTAKEVSSMHETADSNQYSTSCQNGHTGDHRSMVEDDLKVTSDLGLSIDSLHLSEEDNSELTVSNVVPSHLNSVGGMDLDIAISSHGTENGFSAGNELSNFNKILVPGTGYELDTTFETDNAKRITSAKKKGGRKLTKPSNGSSAMQVVASNSSTSLKSSKTIRNSHKTAKKATKRHIKK